ncbi:hypothetical protein E2C01_056902 [Portunus trituberculatus]|uniref:Uncharacterized protein n=1 Tax=Portunus trituberculatus TaxID=210409 RepID=A0A5B7GVE2_PORTR|nr:hypothetical protein [Portunus trituberculatus]
MATVSSNFSPPRCRPSVDVNIVDGVPLQKVGIERVTAREESCQHEAVWVKVLILPRFYPRPGFFESYCREEGDWGRECWGRCGEGI